MVFMKIFFILNLIILLIAKILSIQNYIRNFSYLMLALLFCYTFLMFAPHQNLQQLILETMAYFPILTQSMYGSFVNLRRMYFVTDVICQVQTCFIKDIKISFDNVYLETIIYYTKAELPISCIIKQNRVRKYCYLEQSLMRNAYFFTFTF